MDDFEQPGAPKLRVGEASLPDDVIPAEEVLSQVESETPTTAPKGQPQNYSHYVKLKNKALLIVLAVVLTMLLVGGVVWFVLVNAATHGEPGEGAITEIGDSRNEDKKPVDEPELKDEIISLSVDNELAQRLFSEFDFIADFWTSQPGFYAQAVNGELDRQTVVNSAFLSLDAMRCRGNYEFEMNDGSWQTATNCHSGEAIRQKIMKLFGLKYTFTSNDFFRVLAVPYAYSELNDEFYPTDTGFGGWPTFGIMRELCKAEKGLNRVYLYEIAAYWSVEKNGCGTEVCRLGDKDWSIGVDGVTVDNLMSNEKLSEYPGASEIFDKFKWTFVWNGENYVFEKLERV